MGHLGFAILTDERTWINVDHLREETRFIYLLNKIEAIEGVLLKEKRVEVFVQGHLYNPCNNLTPIMERISGRVPRAKIVCQRVTNMIYLVTCTIPEAA